MKETAEEKHTARVPVNVGLLAHVDAGKTTLAEGMLYTAGKLRKIGRVDHRDAFLDTFNLEKQRGITIFAKQARMMLGDQPVTLLDTPGHVDFSPETERTLQILDYAILIISGTDGVQGHVQTLWRLLKLHQIPVFIFVNKTDLDSFDQPALLQELKKRLSDACTDFSVQDNAFYDSLATGSEEALEQYLTYGRIEENTIRDLIASRRVFPCFFGSALRLSGITEFLTALGKYLRAPAYPHNFGARVFKIARDEHGERLTYVKVTGGSLKVKSVVCCGNADETRSSVPGTWQEKINQIRLYDGAGYDLADEVPAGTVCALTGPAQSRCGDGLGFETGRADAQLVPVLTCRVLLPPEADVRRTVELMQQLGEEEPQLHVVWNDTLGEIHVRVMGAVQLEILKSLILERSGLNVAFGPDSIIYKETITNTVEGVGHFEPLRHYAEVHLLMEPLPRGSGMIFASDCREDRLDLNWQRQVLANLREKQHCGVLTGAELTDMKITLKAGRAHPKHTDGGDFRQAACRAVRQGLMQAHSVLLEPYYAFRLEVPSGTVGRAMSDIQRMSGSFGPVLTDGDMSVLSGRAPVAAMRDYPAEVTSYTRGTGRLTLSISGYDICHNADEIIGAAEYDPARDTENPADSIFCTHGSGSVVPWYKVKEQMHLPSVLGSTASADAGDERNRDTASAAGQKSSFSASDKELKEIFERTFGSGTFTRSNAETAYTSGRRRRTSDEIPDCSGSSSDTASSAENAARAAEIKARKTASRFGDGTGGQKEQYLLVDGYNIIFAWDELNELSRESAQAARGRLMDILCNYQGYRGMTLILVFDAYKVEGNPGESFRYHNIHVVYTKEAETADQYIEKTVHQIGRKYDVTVATSDRLEQIIILGQGAKRMSAPELRAEIEEMTLELRRDHLAHSLHSGRYLFDELTPETAARLKAIRLGKTQETSTT